MPSVILQRPNRVNVMGQMFERGVVTPVSQEIARALEENPRFIVKWAKGEDQNAPDEDTGPKKPVVRQKRMSMIRAAIDQLSEDDEKVWTKDGRPDARALSKILGWTVTNQERDEALARANPEEQLPVLDTAGEVEDVEEEATEEDVIEDLAEDAEPSTPSRPPPGKLLPSRKAYPKGTKAAPPIVHPKQIRPGSEANVASAKGKVVIKKGAAKPKAPDPSKTGAVEV
jgi:hypothetical protein